MCNGSLANGLFRHSSGYQYKGDLCGCVDRLDSSLKVWIQMTTGHNFTESEIIEMRRWADEARAASSGYYLESGKEIAAPTTCFNYCLIDED